MEIHLQETNLYFQQDEPSVHCCRDIKAHPDENLSKR